MPEAKLFVCFTLDCPPAAPGSSYPTPADWDFATASMQGFVDAVAAAGMKSTLFVASDVCKRALDELLAVADRGAELGLLTDPRFEGYKGFLGSYRIEQQKEIIGLGVEAFKDRLRREPESFRSGEFSASRDTLIALCELMFRQCSLSLPERYAVSRYSNWRGAYPFAHHVDPLDMKLPGTLELYETPVTSDFDKTTLNGQSDFTPIFLSPEQPDIQDHVDGLLANHLARMERDAVHMRTLTCTATTCADYRTSDTEACKGLHHIMDAIRRAADENAMDIAPATLAEVHDEADRLYRMGKRS